MPDIFADINKAIRSKYELIYHPTDAKQDGTYRKLRVELVDDEGKPLRFQDEKHKPLKYDDHCARRLSGETGSGVGGSERKTSGSRTAAAVPLEGDGQLQSTLLFELVEDIVDVVADDEKRRDAGNDLRNLDQGLNLVDLGDDGLLRSLLMAEGIVEKDLIFLVLGEPGAIQEHNCHGHDGESPDGPHNGNKRHKLYLQRDSPSCRQDPMVCIALPDLRGLYG